MSKNNQNHKKRVLINVHVAAVSNFVNSARKKDKIATNSQLLRQKKL